MTAAPPPPNVFRTARISNRQISGFLFGHHFAAIAGPGPLVGPTLAAQFGYLPGVLWILVGAVFAGAVQDFRHSVLFRSARRQNAGPNRSRRNRQGSWFGLPGHCSAHHDRAAGRGRPGGRECTERQPVGRLHHRNDHADCHPDGPLSAIRASGQSPGMLGRRLRSGAAQHLRWQRYFGNLAARRSTVHLERSCARAL